MMMSGGNNNNNRFPFTATQWQELEHQALIYKYMISGLPIPPDLLFDVKRSLESSLSSKLMLHQPQHVGWNCFQMGFGRKIDPEPGRCRRTDGKKWRCSKEAYPDSKYCERHMHRGRNRSRKPVEIITTPTPSSSSSTTKPPPNILSSSTSSSSSTITKNTTISNSFLVSPSNTTSSLSSMNTFDTPSYNTHLNHYSFLHPHSSSSRPPGIDFSSQDRDTRDYRYGYGMKGEIDEHGFFSGSSALAHLRQRSSTSDIQSGYPFLQLHGLDDSSKQHKQDYQYFQILDDSDEMQQMQHVGHRENEYDKPQKIMHHFFDELPKNRDSWLHSQDDKSSSYLAPSTTQLSISTPHFSHDFFIDHNLNDK